MTLNLHIPRSPNLQIHDHFTSGFGFLTTARYDVRGRVNQEDLGVLLANWQTVCP